MPQGGEGAARARGCITHPDKTQDAVIYLGGDTQIIATFGRNLAKWVNMVLEEAYVHPHPSRGTPLPPDNTTGAALAMQTTGDTPAPVTDAKDVYY